MNTRDFWKFIAGNDAAPEAPAEDASHVDAPGEEASETPAPKPPARAATPGRDEAERDELEALFGAVEVKKSEANGVRGRAENAPEPAPDPFPEPAPGAAFDLETGPAEQAGRESITPENLAAHEASGDGQFGLAPAYPLYAMYESGPRRAAPPDEQEAFEQEAFEQDQEEPATDEKDQEELATEDLLTEDLLTDEQAVDEQAVDEPAPDALDAGYEAPSPRLDWPAEAAPTASPAAPEPAKAPRTEHVDLAEHVDHAERADRIIQELDALRGGLLAPADEAPIVGVPAEAPPASDEALADEALADEAIEEAPPAEVPRAEDSTADASFAPVPFASNGEAARAESHVAESHVAERDVPERDVAERDVAEARDAERYDTVLKRALQAEEAATESAQAERPEAVRQEAVRPEDGAAAAEQDHVPVARDEAAGDEAAVPEVAPAPEATPHEANPADPDPSADPVADVAASAEADALEEADAPIECDVEASSAPALSVRDRVVTFLLREGAVTAEQVRQAQQRKQRRELTDALWRVLAEGEDVDSEAIYAGAAQVYAFKEVSLKATPPNPEFTRSVMETFAKEQREQLIELGAVPLQAVRRQQREAITLQFITYDPARSSVHRVLRELGIDSYDVLYAPQSAVSALIVEAFPKKNEYLERMEGEDSAFDFGTSYEEDDRLIDEEQLEAEISRSKLINLFEAALVEAVRRGASDLHIYPNADKEVEIHFRVDGRLHPWHTESKIHPEAFLAVVKDNSTNVDRFERDAAQDGFIQRWVDRALIRFRVSVMPIANASQEIRSESIVIRVLDDRKVITDLSKLGLLEGALGKFAHAISQPHGMVIMTGPTGSGKSTTLVAALHSVVTPQVNVLTVEDPVEYIIPGVRQIKLNHKLNLEGALRSILRHDPDVVMVGEMRDRDTAELAIKLANTGHLTFSTLHTNDAPSAISRLYKMGVEPFLIAYAINLVVAQRLIRRLCPDCKRVDPDPDPVLLDRLGFSAEEIETMSFYQPSSDERCPTCKGMGYKGRRAISEALYFSRKVRHMIVDSDGMVDEESIRDQARSEGMLTLLDSAREVVRMGETSVREMLRVVASEAH